MKLRRYREFIGFSAIALVVLLLVSGSKLGFRALKVKLAVPLQNFLLGGDVEPAAVEPFAQRCQYLPGVAFNSPQRCSMLEFPPYYARGHWVRNCNFSEARGELAPLQYAELDNATLMKLYSDGNVFRMNFACSDHHSVEKRRQLLHYYWQPHTCHLAAYNTERMRGILSRHRFLFVGDSIMWQTALSIEYMSGIKVPYARSFILVNHRTLSPMTKEELEYCAEMQRIDAPDDSCPQELPYHRALRTLNWTLLLPETDVLVFSVGHHWWKEDKDFTRFKTMADRFTAFLAKHFPGKIAIFVSAVWGHRYCLFYDSPLETIPLSNETDTDDIFHWKRAIRVQESFRLAIAEHTHQRGTHPHMVYLYMNHTALRPEAHYKPGIDCLHYCQPGVVDTWVHFLYNLFEDLHL
eukprot:m.243899 g.243899  ORF g.243899 m.243899 type:complete len:408 (+) comp28849_c0_seq1:57-1280(+)